MLFFQFPLSTIINQPALNVNVEQLLGFNNNSTPSHVTLITNNGTTDYIVPNAATSIALISAMNSLIGQAGSFVISPMFCRLLNCVPTTFAGHGSTIDIFGTGFYPSMASGVINIEDSAGGYDSNGFQYSITYISPTHIQATWLSDGDATVGASFIYFTDVNGFIIGEVTGITTT